MNSNFLKLLSPGDVVLADRGFTIEEDLKIHNAKLEIPAFATGKKQFSLKEVEETKHLSKVRIHIERVIRLSKTNMSFYSTKFLSPC